MNIGVFPAPLTEEVRHGLGLAGASLLSLDELNAGLEALRDVDALIVALGDQPMWTLRQITGVAQDVGLPVIVVVDAADLATIDGASGVTDFVVSPINGFELALRVRRAVGTVQAFDTLGFKDLEINTLNYQASLDGSPLDLTYMEYELLRFLVENRGRVWSRQQLLSRVWGYGYFGGARTVDVHVRRLRAKLGEERASWITTVRSVGYRFG